MISSYSKLLVHLGLLVFFLLFMAMPVGWAYASFPAPEIKYAQVRSQHMADGWIGTAFLAGIAGPSPEDVVSFTATGPSGTFSLVPWKSVRQWGLSESNSGLGYMYSEASILTDGSYTFVVTDSLGRTASVVKNFTYNPSLAQVDSATMMPQDQAYVGTTTPTLSFDPVSGGGVYYQVTVSDYNYNAVWYVSERIQATSFTVPGGVLQPNTPYEWFVRVFDSDADPQNLHESEPLVFYTSAKGVPDLSGGKFVDSWPFGEDYSYAFMVNETNVAPWDINTLTVTGPDATVYNLDGLQFRFCSPAYYFSFGNAAPLPIPDGDYTFYIQDNEGNEDIQTVSYTYNPVPAVSEESRVPADNAYLDTNTPTFSWAPVTGNGTYYYMLRITDYMSLVVWYDSPCSTATSVTVPEGVLVRGNSYQWRAFVIDSDGESAPSNNSNASSRRSFTVSANNLPEKPLLSSPADGATDVSLTPTLQTGSFSDPDSGDIHLQTEWQISTVSDFSSTILDTTSISQLTSLTVPQFVLAEGVTYYWRVRFYDNHSNVSEWSDVYSFTTLTTSNDQNGNGIPDSQENDTVDLDDDGTSDIEQDDIKSLNTVVGEGQMGVSRRADPTVTAIESIESIDPVTISGLARPYSMPLGLFAMRLTVANPGDTVQVTVYFSEAAPSGAKWYMYDSIDGWVDYSDHATFSADRKSVILELKDGDYGDADDLANGTIVDPGGFGLASWIEGLICDSSTDQGIARAQVTISELALSADLDGHYLSMILPGTYTVAVSATGYDPATCDNVVVPEGGTLTQDVALSAIPGYLVTTDLWIRAVINTEEKGPIEAVWQKGGEDTTSRGDRVIWGHFYASPNDLTWGSENNPDLFVKIWFDVSGRVDVNYFHVSVPDIEVYSDYPYDGTPDEHGTTTMERRYIRQYYEGGQSHSEDNYEDGVPAAGYSQTGNPSGYSTINDLRIGSTINTVEKGSIDAIWRLGGQDTTSRGDQVVWGHYYANPSDVTWGSQDNPDLFVKIWFDVSGRVDVNFFHVSVPDIEVYSDLPTDAAYDQKGTTIMADRYIRHEYWR